VRQTIRPIVRPTYLTFPSNRYQGSNRENGSRVMIGLWIDWTDRRRRAANDQDAYTHELSDWSYVRLRCMISPAASDEIFTDQLVIISASRKI